jgi:hypothetical protein
MPIDIIGIICKNRKMENINFILREDNISILIKKLINIFPYFISDYALDNQSESPVLVIENLVKYINKNKIKNSVVKKINKIFNEEIYSEYDNISYLIFTYFIEKLDKDKLKQLNKVATHKLKKIIKNFYIEGENIKLKYSINNILAEWDPIDVIISIKYIEYFSYVDKIILIGNNRMDLKIFLIHLVKDIIGLDFDENNKNHEKDIDRVVEKIIKLYE